MVTIIDMVTGELIHSDAPTASQPAAAAAPSDRSFVAPRLQTVEEAIACEPRRSGMPADMYHLNIDKAF